MGFKTEFNWVLKLRPEQGLKQEIKEGEEYDFSKDDYGVYPIGVPVDLINKDIEAVAKVIINKIKHEENKTKGKFKIIKIFNKEEKEFLTNYWRETITYFKKVDSFKCQNSTNL